jgi:hypothetical protein
MLSRLRNTWAQFAFMENKQKYNHFVIFLNEDYKHCTLWKQEHKLMQKKNMIKTAMLNHVTCQSSIQNKTQIKRESPDIQVELDNIVSIK